MPIKFDLEALRQEFGCVHYCETGLFDPRGDVSLKRALAANFTRVQSIEIRPDYVRMGQFAFKEAIAAGRCQIYQDDSVRLAKYLTDPSFVSERIMFFLDAHVDNIRIQGYQKRCPLFEELNAIASLARKDHLILIDDLRIIVRPRPWEEASYGNIDFLAAIKAKILEINPDYKFRTLDGQIRDDVLLAYV
jgi:hypothetical protein